MFSKMLKIGTYNSLVNLKYDLWLIHNSQMTPFGGIYLDQHRHMQWFAAWRHQIIVWTNAYVNAILLEMHKIYLQKHSI